MPPALSLCTMGPLPLRELRSLWSGGGGLPRMIWYVSPYQKLRVRPATVLPRWHPASCHVRQPCVAGATGDFSGLVDIAVDRSTWSGPRPGSPTVILESGAGGRPTSDPGAAGACGARELWSYPGCGLYPASVPMPSGHGSLTQSLPRSGWALFFPKKKKKKTKRQPHDPVLHPRTTQDRVNDLHSCWVPCDPLSLRPGRPLRVGLVGGFMPPPPPRVPGLCWSAGAADSTHEDVCLRFPGGLAPTLGGVPSAHRHQQELPDAYPEAGAVYPPVGDESAHRPGTPRRGRNAPCADAAVVLPHGIPFADPFPAGRVTR